MARTDGDTWDLTTGVGITATFSAAARAVATTKGLINDPFAESLVRAAGVEYFVRLIEDHAYSTDGGIDPVTTGMINVLAVHGRFLDGFLTQSVRAGIRQVVNLGAGLDTRAYRLWWPVGTTVYELDRPDVTDFKVRMMRELGAKLSVNRCAVGVDLRDDWLTALLRTGFDPVQPTLWIAENLLLGYLPPDAQDRLLRDITGVSAAGSQFAADHLPWTQLQLQEGHAFIDLWRRQGLDVDLTKLTYTAEFPSVPENLAAQRWQICDRDIVELLGVVGLGGRRRMRPRDIAASPRYVTGMLPGDTR
ncbi:MULTISPECIES: SAM-dependent methyltransferase [Mycobacterium]|uniref:S-adenosyl-L-methionine-dependent methyltransferase n=1 Tax=Mycobacterium kiyosense TaxID=2871094 RepID=A0A9P3Q8R9_9MYCO|nr:MULTISPECIES: class I SAM-dependent methyltransferase [Mycobacterium]BDB40257.1 putative S-adenosyl-L-methionine-dependent methyltransferase [Mycobacterium kiyosense]BDE12080.1 putative S-adenosyl-L-methionine-dependent methyltransferase [Mycobacterium sp. 20KCMC460]GLB83704.1 putative S-adenosyl-L-methionine-dependent methyltransferase [Mycobacterium kiyosense]GLB88766.1 putative S-adenosyl-L-methionine-dependent methyltransferase [Mycobacterium kiyosense]GLB96375.1 putative S-adenosyl-L-m